MTQRAISAAIVDCGLGNLFSVCHACAHVGMTAAITDRAADLLQADLVLLPGVGAFGDAMDALHRRDLVAPLHEVAASGKPLVGICLGLQLLMSESYEFGRHAGLGVIEGPVVRFEQPRLGAAILKVPQVGWNRVARPEGTGGDPWTGTPLDGLPDGAYMYFVHSYYAQPADPRAVLCRSTYGHIAFASAVRRGNVYGFQFHPERSGPQGLQMYRTLAAQVAARFPEPTGRATGPRP